MASDTLIDRISKTPALLIIGLTADVAACVAVFSLDTVRRFVTDNALVFVLISAFLLATSVSLLSWAARLYVALKSERARNMEAIRQVEGNETKTPTERDRQLFHDILAMFPFEKGFLAYLDHSFNPKRWINIDVRPLYEFLAAHEKKFFDDPEVERAYRQFYSNCDELAGWLAYEGAAVYEDLSVYTIKPGNLREGGWPERDAEILRALGFSKAILESRLEFEKVGRARNL